MRQVLSFSVDSPTALIIERAVSRCEGNASKGLRLIVAEWDVMDRKRESAAQFDRQMAQVAPVSEESVAQWRKTQDEINRIAPRKGFVTREEWEASQAAAKHDSQGERNFEAEAADIRGPVIVQASPGWDRCGEPPDEEATE